MERVGAGAVRLGPEGRRAEYRQGRSGMTRRIVALGVALGAVLMGRPAAADPALVRGQGQAVESARGECRLKAERASRDLGRSRSGPSSTTLQIWWTHYSACFEPASVAIRRLLHEVESNRIDEPRLSWCMASGRIRASDDWRRGAVALRLYNCAHGRADY